jgi:type IV pilus assembly protein PilW
MKTHHQMTKKPGLTATGFSLVELMIAITIGLIILATMSLVLVNSMQSRSELEKSSVQIENGRFAVEALREDIQLAGFYGDYFPSTSITWQTADPCSTVLADMNFVAASYRWNATLISKVPVGIQGYTDTATTPGCLANRKAGTDILVVRRAGTSAIKIDADGTGGYGDGTADANVTNEDGTTPTLASLDGGYYLQVSNCSASPSETVFVMDKDTSRFTRHKVKPSGTPLSCMNGGLSPLRKYISRIFYISTCNDCTGGGDGIPTLKMVELTAGTSSCKTDETVACGSFTTRAIAAGIENLQLEYGIDTTLDGAPDTFSAAPTAADWPNVVAVKVFLLARNTEQTASYTDTKTYSLDSAGTTLTGTPFNDHFKRHVYSATVNATNIAGRR